MNDKIKTIIIGMGRMGRCRYDAMERHGGFEVIAICDNDPTTLEHYSEKKYTRWKECLTTEKPDAVMVCAVNDVIPSIVCTALKNGLHVFAEKPPGKTLEDAQRMKSCHTHHQNLVLKFGFNHRYHNSIIEAKSLLDSGFLGDIVFVRGTYGKAGNKNFANEWRSDPSISGGGILIDQGIHMLDLMRYFIGDFSLDYSSVDRLVWMDINAEDSALAVFRTPKHQIATLHSSALQWKHKFDMDIICTGGYIALNGLITSTRSYGEERITYYRKDLELKSGKIGNPKENHLCFDEDFSWDLEIEEFYEAVINSKPVINGTIEDAVAVMRLVSDIYGYSDIRDPHRIERGNDDL